MSKKYNKIEVKETTVIEEEEENVEEVDSKNKGLTSVMSEKPTVVKKGLLSRLVTGVIGPEGLPGIGSYVNDEIVKPAIKNIIVDAVTSGINMVMYGDRGGGYNGRGYGGGGYGSGYRNRYNGGSSGGYRPQTSYGSNYRNNRDRRDEPQDDRVVYTGKNNGVIDYVIKDRYDASHVLTALTENADRFNSVSVADYYDLIGMESAYTDNNHGWTIDSIVRASIIPVRNGYMIKFPPVEIL